MDGIEFETRHSGSCRLIDTLPANAQLAQPALTTGGGGKCEGGLRTREGFKKYLDGKPWVTVVTVVFNDAQNLEATLKSVICQTYSNIEYIVIDGGSNDGTLEIIRKYEESIDYWVSERDEGIYDAMNKGVDLASGSWINYMNAGDQFFDEMVIESIFINEIRHDEADVIYGDVLVVYPEYNYMSKVRKAGRLSDLWKGMQFSHQSVLIAADYIRQNKFNLTYRLAADFNLIYSAYRQGRSFFYTGQTLASTSSGGASDIQRVQVYRERMRIVFRMNGQALALLYYSIRMVDACARWALKRVLPSWIIKEIVQKK